MVRVVHVRQARARARLHPLHGHAHFKDVPKTCKKNPLCGARLARPIDLAVLNTKMEINNLILEVSIYEIVLIKFEIYVNVLIKFEFFCSNMYCCWQSCTELGNLCLHRTAFN